MITGYFPSATGRNTSARSTTPSSISIGASQSIFIPSRISDFISNASATVSFGGRGTLTLKVGVTKEHVRKRRHHRRRPVGLHAPSGTGPDRAAFHARRGRGGAQGRGCRRQGHPGHGGGVVFARARCRGGPCLEARAVAPLAGARHERRLRRAG